MTVQSKGYSKAQCGHDAYQVIYQRNRVGVYQTMKICLFCKNEVSGY